MSSSRTRTCSLVRLFLLSYMLRAAVASKYDRLMQIQESTGPRSVCAKHSYLVGLSLTVCSRQIRLLGFHKKPDRGQLRHLVAIGLEFGVSSLLTLAKPKAIACGCLQWIIAGRDESIGRRIVLLKCSLQFPRLTYTSIARDIPHRIQHAVHHSPPKT